MKHRAGKSPALTLISGIRISIWRVLFQIPVIATWAFALAKSDERLYLVPHPFPMSPQPPSPSDDSGVPPGSRPSLGITAKDSTELDLWEFDDVPGIEESPANDSQKQAKLLIPAPRHVPSKEMRLDSPSQKPVSPTLSDVVVEIPENIRLKMHPKSRSALSSMPLSGQESVPGRNKPGENFKDLDQWEEQESLPELPTHLTTVPAAVVPNSFKEISTLQAEAAADVILDSASRASVTGNDRDGFSGKAAQAAGAPSVPFRPVLKLNSIERLGLGVLLVLLLALGGVFYFNTIRRIPSGTSLVEVGDFPITGKKMAVAAVETYWREPVTSGPDADTVRREALLIPVAEFATSGGPAAIRIFFRDSDGTLVGDAVSRAVQGNRKFKVSATSGFDDLAKHAAYRTGQVKPWTIEVLEGPSESAPTTEFKRLFEMNIASDRK